MSHVQVHAWRSWFSAGGRTTEIVQWKPGMRVGELVPARMAGLPGLAAYRNGQGCQDMQTEVQVGDHVDFAVRPGGPAFMALPLLVQVLIGAAALMGLNAVLSGIIGRPKGPKKRGDEESAHSGWGGPQNVRVEGQPRIVVYGQFRVAGTIIDEYIVTKSAPPTSTLYSLSCFGEGPIEAIGDHTTDNDTDTPLSSEDAANPIPTGIQVDGNALENLRQVQAHVRMGTADQEPVPGFEMIATEYVVEQTLTQAETTGSQQDLNEGLNLVTAGAEYNSDDPAAQALWDEYGATFDLTSEADLFTALVNFPSGLYRIDSSGNLEDAGFQLLMRYMELDALGIPIETGGDNGDGWVYVPPAPMLIAAQNKPFGREYSAAFLDPQEFVAGSLGRACFFDGTDDYASTDPSATDTIPNAPASWAAGQNMAEITIEGWVQLDGIPLTGGSDYRPLIEISDAALNRGIALFIQRHDRDLGGGGLVAAWIPTVYIGNGTSATAIHEDTGSFQNFIPHTTGLTAFHYVACTYKRIDATTARIRIYLNGVLAHEITGTSSTLRVLSAGKALEMARSRRFQATTYTEGRFDEWRIHDREFEPAEILTAYDGGIGTYGVADADLVAGWHLDEGIGVTTGQDFGDYASSSSLNDLFFKNGAGTGAAGTGWITEPGAGPRKRSRYRVGLLRLNLKSSVAVFQDESVWALLYGKVDELLAYPLKPLLATIIQATDQLSGTRPLITALVKGRPCPIWDGLSSASPTITPTWTKNPAWVCVDIATNKRYGLGKDFEITDIDLDSVMEWATYCDELVYDNRGGQQGIHESTTSFPIFDLRFDSTLFDGFGGIEIFFRSSPSVVQPPRRWVAGRFLGFTGIPAPSGSHTVDINTSNISGMEIGLVEFTGGAWVVTVRYATATYGAPWTDGGFITSSMSSTLVGTVEGRERRFEYSWPHDTFRPAWDALIDVAMTGRAMPVREGRRLRFRVEKPRSPVGVVTMTSILPGSFEIEYGGRADRVNSYQADYWDEDQNYDRKNASMDDPELANTAAEDEIHRESITLEGITRRTQVMRDLYFRLQVQKLCSKSGRYRTGLEQLAYEAGDVVQLSHDLVPWGVGGAIGTGSTTSTIILDREITIPASPTYYLRITPPGQIIDGTQVRDRYETVEVTEAAGTYPAGTGISVAAGLTFAPAKDDTYVFYKESEVFLAEITEISTTEDFERAVEWVKYDAAVYDVDTLPSDQ
jgi:hypothetical protein